MGFFSTFRGERSRHSRKFYELDPLLERNTLVMPTNPWCSTLIVLQRHVHTIVQERSRNGSLAAEETPATDFQTKRFSSTKSSSVKSFTQTEDSLVSNEIMRRPKPGRPCIIFLADYSGSAQRYRRKIWSLGARAGSARRERPQDYAHRSDQKVSDRVEISAGVMVSRTSTCRRLYRCVRVIYRTGVSATRA